jgi:hypothetical protein
MVALSASRLVWLAISLMSWTTSPMRWAASSRTRTPSLACCASSTADLATAALSPTMREISWLEAASSSAADATVWTLDVASSAEPETLPAALSVRPAFDWIV